MLQSDNATSPQVHRGATVNAYAAGARGLLFHRYYPQPHHWPYTAEDLNRIRYAAFPDILAYKDKNFRLGPTTSTALVPALAHHHAGPKLPLALAPGGAAAELGLEISEDLAAAAGEGLLWRCELVVSLTALTHIALLTIDDPRNCFWVPKDILYTKSL